MKERTLLFLLLVAGCSPATRNQLASDLDADRVATAAEIKQAINNTVDAWYPRSVDSLYGGFLSSFSYDWKAVREQQKMIVTQARHTWVTAQVAEHDPRAFFKTASANGFLFLKNKMWDSKHGGFYTLVARQGDVLDSGKTAYGNAFGIYALAAYYHMSNDTAALSLAQKAFRWLEGHSHDPVHKGYFQHMDRSGTPLMRTPKTNSKAETGYKDQNSSIHLLEAFTALYQVWPDALLRDRLAEMLYLIRDVIVTKKGYLTLFFNTDWTPVSYRDSSEALLNAHHNLDHVSFGHDVETAYLMVDASETLGNKNDTTTWRIAKRMMDHSLRNGWDSKAGGFYDEGYYFKGEDHLRIIRDSKNWWAQAEGLNTLLMMADRYPDDTLHYFSKFQQQWRYIDRYVIDHEFGDWFAGGLDKEPFQKRSGKGNIWKGCYHQYRAMAHCLKRLTTKGEQ